MSSVPAAIDGLITVVEMALADFIILRIGETGPVTGAQRVVWLCDGAPNVWPDQDAIVVGWSPDRVSVTVETSQEGLSGADRERYDIASVISCIGGDAELKSVRDRTFGFYTEIADYLKANPTLSGAVLKARPSVAEVIQNQNQSGVTVDLTFLVTCDAFAN